MINFDSLLLLLIFASFIYLLVRAWQQHQQAQALEQYQGGVGGFGGSGIEVAEAAATTTQTGNSVFQSLRADESYVPTHAYTEQQTQARQQLLAATTDSKGWETLPPNNGVEIYRRPGVGELPLFMGKCVMNSPLKVVFGLLTDMKKKTLYDTMFRRGHCVQQLDDYTRVMYFEYAKVWPTSARDFCLLVSVQPEADGSVLIYATSVAHPSCPEVPGNVRAHVIYSGWHLHPGRNENECSATYIASVLLGGSLPTPILKLAARTSLNLLSTIRDVSKKLSEKDFLPPPPPPPSPPTTPSSTTHTTARSQSFSDSLPYSYSSSDVKQTDRRESFGEERELSFQKRLSSARKGIGLDRRLLSEHEVMQHLRLGEDCIASVLKETGPPNAAKWKRFAIAKDVRLYGRKQKEHQPTTHAWMGRGVIDAPASEIFTLLTNPLARKCYDNMVKDIHVVRKLAPNAAVVWACMATRNCLLDTGRDFCVLNYYRTPNHPVPDYAAIEDLQGKYVLISKSVKDPSCPETEITRGEVTMSGWIVEELSKGECLVTTFIEIDFKGAVPSALLNIVGRQQPLCIFHLREYLLTL